MSFDSCADGLEHPLKFVEVRICKCGLRNLAITRFGLPVAAGRRKDRPIPLGVA
jgi:hypothetical protein